MRIGRLAGTAVLVIIAGMLMAGPGLRSIIRNEFQQSLHVQFSGYKNAKLSLKGKLEAEDLQVTSASLDDSAATDSVAFEGLDANQKSNSTGSDSSGAKTRIDRVILQLSLKELAKRRLAIEGAILQGVHLAPRAFAKTCLTEGSSIEKPQGIDWFPRGLLGGSPSDAWTRFEKENSLTEEPKLVAAKMKSYIERLDSEKRELESRVAQLRAIPNDALNPLRDRETLLNQLRESKELAERIAQFQKRMQEAEGELKKDFQSATQARQSQFDTMVSQRYQGGLDAHAIARGILIEMARSALTKVEDSVQAIAGSPMQSDGLNRYGRGDDSALDEYSSRGRVELRAAKWDGDVTIGDEQFKIEGVVQGWSSQPDWNSSGPAKVTSLARSSSSEIRFVGTRLHQNTKLWDTYEVVAPRFGFAQWRIGNRQGMELIGHGDPVSVQVRSFMSDGVPRSEIALEQSGLTLQAQGDPDQEASSRLSQVMAQSLATCKSLRLIAEVEGDPAIDDHWRVESNLEELLENGLRDALRSEIAMLQKHHQEQYRLVCDRVDSELQLYTSSQVNALQLAAGRLQREVREADQILTAKIKGDRSTRFARESMPSAAR